MVSWYWKSNNTDTLPPGYHFHAVGDTDTELPAKRAHLQACTWMHVLNGYSPVLLPKSYRCMAT